MRSVVPLAAVLFFGAGGCSVEEPAPVDSPTVVSACGPDRLAIQPVLYLPSDATLSVEDETTARELLTQHLELGQEFYRAILETDTFCYEPTATYHSKRTTDRYLSATSPDSAHLMVRSLLEWAGETRNDSLHVFLVLFVRPAGQPHVEGTKRLGGGRTFNGYPGAGGGVVQLEITSLFEDTPYPFQSTLVHELGHAFGLTHSNCFGEDMSTGCSIMSYNHNHWSDGLTQSEEPGELLPEELYLLDQNDLAFPNFSFDPSRHNPTGRTLTGINGTCELGAMDASIGVMARSGYELFIDEVLVSGPEAQLYTRGRARSNCESNIASQPAGIAVRGLFDGQLLGQRD